MHYLEGLPPVGGISFAQLWKMPVIFFLLCYAIFSLRKKQAFEKWGYTLGIEYAFGAETFINPMGMIVRIFRTLPVFLLYGFWVQKFSDRKKLIETFIYCFAQFIPLASFLVLTGIITPLQEEVSAESFGIENLVYFSGIFGSAHAASSYFCASILVLIFGFMQKRFTSRGSKIFNALLIVISLISIFRSYTRTGWLMLLVGILILIFGRGLTLKRLSTGIILTACIGVGLIYLFHTNEAFSARLTGYNRYTGQGGEAIETSGSGRTSLWQNGVEHLWNSNNGYYFLFGEGFTNLSDNNEKVLGMRVFSHNQFLDALTQNGILGLLILLGVFVAMFMFIRRRQYPYQLLCYAMYFSNLVFAMFQNEMYFDYAILFSLALAILQLESIDNSETNEVDVVSKAQ